MKARVVPIILLFLSSVLSAGEFPGKVRKWHGFDLHEFRQGPSGCKVVIPNDPAEGNHGFGGRGSGGMNPRRIKPS